MRLAGSTKRRMRLVELDSALSMIGRVMGVFMGILMY